MNEIRNEVETNKKIEDFKNTLLHSVIEKITEITEEEITKLMSEDRKYGVTSSLILPSNTTEQAQENFKRANDKNIEDKDFYSKKEKQSLWLASKGFSNVVDPYIYTDKSDKEVIKNFNNEGDYVFEYTTKDGSIKIKNLDFLTILDKTPDDKKIPEDTVMNIFKSFVSAGEIIKIPLWHSGFSVDINPPTVKDIVSTQNAINDDLVKTGIQTANLMYSNLSVITNKHIINLFLSLLNKWTLDVNKEDLLNHISALDIPLITLGILASMYPQGVEITTTCTNVLETENDRSKCDFSIKGNVDFKKMLNVDKGKVEKIVGPLLNNFLKVTSRSVPVKVCEEYKKRIDSCEAYGPIEEINDKFKDVNLNTEDKSFRLYMRVPTINEFLEEANMFLEELEKRVVDAMGSSYDEKDNITSFIVSMTYITIYSAFIKSIKINNPQGKELELTSRNSLYGALLSISSVGNDPSLVNNVIIDYINDVMVAIIGTPNYICPKCKKQRDGNKNEHINIMSVDKLFFSLATLRTLKAVGEMKNS